MAKKRQLTTEEKLKVRQLQTIDGQLRCYISGEIINDKVDELEYDHLEPYSLGGESNISNERVFKKKYNREKGNMKLKDYRLYFQLKRLYEKNLNKVRLQDIYAFKEISNDSINTKEDGNHLEITDGNKTIIVQLYYDNKLDVKYFYTQLPVNWILNDDQQGLQPRFIDLKRLWQLKNHLIEFPQLAPSIARLMNNEIRLFDGQHKLAAQLLNESAVIDVKVYISPNNQDVEKIIYEKLLKTNLEAHSKLKQVEFFTNTLFQKWNEMHKIKWEEYLEEFPQQDHSEYKFIEYLKLKEGKTEALKMFEATIIKNAHENSVLKKFTSESNKDSSVPLSQDLLKKSLFKALIYQKPSEAIIDSKEDFRDSEAENFAIISNIIVEKGYLNHWTSSKKGLTTEQQIARRIWTKGSVITWAPMINVMINATFQLFDSNEQAKNLYRRKMNDDEKEKFELFFDRLFNHPFWGDKSNPLIDKALGASTSVTDIFQKQNLTSSYILNGK